MTSTIKPITPLRQRMIDDMRIRNLADNTQSAYATATGLSAMLKEDMSHAQIY
jgi:hypothetical protein